MAAPHFSSIFSALEVRPTLVEEGFVKTAMGRSLCERSPGILEFSDTAIIGKEAEIPESREASICATR